jgi:phosphonopyruvate decarboxylase
MGQITHDLLSLMGIAHAPLPDQPDALPAAFDKADASIGRDDCFAFVMADDSMEMTKLNAGPARAHQDIAVTRLLNGGTLPTRAHILERFLRLTGDERAVIATTGKSGRELFMLNDRPQHLYLVGSMGGAAGVGLGVALNSSRPVAVLDGDGAALMKLGTLATIGAQAPANLIHILLDNGVHDSTGGQPTVSVAVDFAAIAAACSYRNTATCDSVEDFAELFDALCKKDGPSLLHVRIAPGSLAKLIRPTVKPKEVARRFRAFLAGAAP